MGRSAVYLDCMDSPAAMPKSSQEFQRSGERRQRRAAVRESITKNMAGVSGVEIDRARTRSAR